MKIHNFKAMKDAKQKIAVVTCYDYWSARIISQSNIDCILVGDSAAMVIHGYETTIPATIEMMATHTAAVAKGTTEKFIVADMSFLSFRKSLNEVMNNVEKLMQAGAHAIKLEGSKGNEEIIKHIVESGVPVMGHLGLTPQSVHQLGGYKVQGRKKDIAKQIIAQAKTLEDQGVFSIVLECVPSPLAKEITESLSVPTIGIGAGADVDGQVLVLQDMLGLNLDFQPKFAKKFIEGGDIITEALNSYAQEVKESSFPAEQHSFKE